MRRTHINSIDDTALLAVLLAKHSTSCNNVFLKGNFLLATCVVFHPIYYLNSLNQKVIRNQ
jgi:hypothetical protein